MPVDEMFDILPQDAAWGHEMAQDADGLELHYVRRGHGSPTVLLLHGWPGFWYDWRRVLPRLEQITSVIAMDLRGFGASAKPDWPPRSAYSAEAQARNVLALLDQLQLETVLLVGYDVGSRVAQTVAQLAPGRVQGLALSAPVYAGFGTRPLEPAAQKERWYQHFHMIVKRCVSICLIFMIIGSATSKLFVPKSLKQLWIPILNRELCRGVLPGIERVVDLDKWPSPIRRVNWPLSLTRPLSCGERLILFSCQVGQIDWRNIFPILSVFRC